MVRYLNPVDRKSARVTKADKDFEKKLDFKDINFPVEIKNIQKIEKKNSIGISAFGYENKEKHPINVLKNFCEDKHVDLLLVDEREKKHYVFIKNFNTFMYNHTLHRGKRTCYDEDNEDFENSTK